MGSTATFIKEKETRLHVIIPIYYSGFTLPIYYYMLTWMVSFELDGEFLINSPFVRKKDTAKVIIKGCLVANTLKFRVYSFKILSLKSRKCY